MIIVAVEDVLPVADNAEFSPLVMAYASWERIEAGAEKAARQWEGDEEMVEWLVQSHLIQEQRLGEEVCLYQFSKNSSCTSPIFSSHVYILAAVLTKLA
ncbi:hypothetical protein IFM47457_05721 [Aspergillus lentulus]|nr:hypothetical protein IFM47457_05721 [Aspergillus lentulus]